MKITIPTTLKDITLRQYQRYINKAEQIDKSEAGEDLKIQTKISVLCSVPMADVLKIQMSDVWLISNKIDEVIRMENDYVQKVTIDNKKFGFHTDLNSMSWGEFLDLNNNISEWETMHIAMGVLYRPIIKEGSSGKYAIEEYQGDKYHEQLKDITMDAVVGAMVFFWNLGTDLLIAITKYLDDQQTTFPKQVNLLESGVGTQLSMNSLAGMLQSLKK